MASDFVAIADADQAREELQRILKRAPASRPPSTPNNVSRPGACRRDILGERANRMIGQACMLHPFHLRMRTQVLRDAGGVRTALRAAQCPMPLQDRTPERRQAALVLRNGKRRARPM